jgi:hypothetical protein
MIKGGHENEIVLLTSEETITAKEVVDVINETTGRQVKFKIVSPEEYAREHGANDQGGKHSSKWLRRGGRILQRESCARRMG